ncbi:MAG: cytochrome C, partial [Acidobacteriota bacterium]|nr:cytochrome C [Acidobacteriota bacterium]
ALVVTALLLVWSLAVDAPLEAPANPNLTPNPAKAPWYFAGLQELLVYFDPWFAGVALPTLIVLGLLLFPYLDPSPLRGGYYSLKQRRVPAGAFFAGFALWIGAILVGVFLRGPGWMWFWPGETWDHSRVVEETTRDLPDLFGIHGAVGKGVAGAMLLAALYWGAALGIRWLVTRTEADRRTLARASRLQYALFRFFAITILVLVPVKILLRLIFHVKYILVTGWFNV